jgi:hypothetical protein
MTRPLLPALLCLAIPAAADTARWQHEPHGSQLHLRPTTEPNAVAEVWFNNTSGDSGGRIMHGFRLGDLDVTLTLGGPEPDTLTIDAPEGFIADPRTLTLPDGTSGVIYIRPLGSVGM